MRPRQQGHDGPSSRARSAPRRASDEGWQSTIERATRANRTRVRRNRRSRACHASSGSVRRTWHSQRRSADQHEPAPLRVVAGINGRPAARCRCRTSDPARGAMLKAPDATPVIPREILLSRCCRWKRRTSGCRRSAAWVTGVQSGVLFVIETVGQVRRAPPQKAGPVPGRTAGEIPESGSPAPTLLDGRTAASRFDARCQHRGP